jgi:hypothetical protein
MFLVSCEEEYKVEDKVFLSTPNAAGDVDAIIAWQGNVSFAVLSFESFDL